MSTYIGNIRKNYFFILFANLDFTRGLWMIFLASRGFTLAQLGILEGLFHVTSFLMEVPTGTVADLWGRKTSRIWGRIMWGLSLLIMFFSPMFRMQMIGFAFCAVGYNLESGAGDALVYDSLLISNRENRYMHVVGRQELIYQAAAVIAFLTGGYFAVRNYGTAFFLSGVFCAASLAAAFTFREPPLNRNQTAAEKSRRGMRGVIASMIDQTVDSLKVIRRRPKIAWLIVFSELIFTFLTTSFFYLQNYWKGQGRDELFIGIVFAISAAVGGFTSLAAPKIEKRIGETGVLVAMPAGLILCLWGIAVTPFMEVFYVITGIVSGVLIVAVSDYINRLVPSANRATVLSFQSMAFSFFMIVFFPLLGWIGDTRGLAAAFRIQAAMATLCGLAYYLLAKKVLFAAPGKDGRETLI